MLIGGHFPISGGLEKAIDLAEEFGGNTIQIFSKNPGQWKAREITEDEAGKFRDAAKSKGISPVIIHDSYLINLATIDEALREKSIKSFVDEIKRAESLGAEFIVTHMGAHKGIGEEAGIRILAESLMDSIKLTSSSRVKILLETTAGQGTHLGYKFEHIAEVISLCGGDRRLGICIDTCHIFAAGYDISHKSGYDKTMDSFEKICGFENLYAVHLNDSKKPCGSRVDRHEHIGRGFIGLEGFRMITNDQRFKNIPLILETPEPEKMHGKNIKILKSLIKPS